MSLIPLSKALSDEILTARLKSKLTRKALHERSQVSAQTIYRIEKKRLRYVSGQILNDLAPHIGLSIDDIIKHRPEGVTQFATRHSGTTGRSVPDPSATRSSIAVFLGAPMHSSGAKYQALRQRMIYIADELKLAVRPGSVFCAHVDRPTIADFEDESLALLGNLAHLRNSKRLLAIYPEERVTSVLIEIGTALGLGIPSLVLVRDRLHLPWVLRGASSGPLLRVIRFRNFEDISTIICTEIKWLRAENP